MHPVIILWAHHLSMSTAIEPYHLPFDELLRLHNLAREPHGN